jgi:SAM-dependent methyltransferase
LAASPRFSPSSRARLTRHDLGRFAGATLFDRIGRALCEAGSLPRKELYEAWEVARRARRVLRGGRVLDVAGGHGLLAHLMLLLDDSSASALVVDPSPPASADAVGRALAGAWPKLDGRVAYVRSGLDAVSLEPSDVVVSCHACGALTDRILERAASAGASVAVMPCCHDATTCDAGDLEGWMDVSLAIDAVRVQRLRGQGYRVRTQTIPATITPKNRLILGERGRA